MPYVAPGTVAAGDVYTAAAHNIQVANVIALYSTVQRIGYQERTTSLASATTFAGAGTAFGTAISFTADGTSSYRIHFYAGASDTTTAQAIHISLDVSGVETGYAQQFAISTRMGLPMIFERFLTPTAGAKTINFRFWAASSAQLTAGTGVGSTSPPMYMAVYGPPLA